MPFIIDVRAIAKPHLLLASLKEVHPVSSGL